jgi:hypothetical protein
MSSTSPLHPRDEAGCVTFLENLLLPWVRPGREAYVQHPQNLLIELRSMFHPFYKPRSRFVTYYRETHDAISDNADHLLTLLRTGNLNEHDLRTIVHEVPIQGWDDQLLTGDETLDELADSFAYRLGFGFTGPFTIEKIRSVCGRQD